jgi:class 3 adenylate cyclase
MFQNTWGDGLFLVFGDAVDCADLALRLLEQFESMVWSDLGLPPDTALRVGLHAGPVYRGRDPIIRRESFFGTHVSRAARIEPVTPPGSAYASEQLAALLADLPGHDLVCDYVGIQALAKGFDRCALYRLRRR